MFKRCFVGVVSVLALTALSAQADSKDDIQTAVQKLADAPNYTWVTTTVNNGGGMNRGPVTGKVEKDGLTYVTGKIRDNEFAFLIKGDKAAVKTPDGWKGTADANNDDQGGAGGFSPGRFIAMFVANFQTPVQQIQSNLDKLQNIQKTDNGYTADLSPDGAKDALFHRRPTTQPDDNAPQIDVSNAKGTAKFTIEDGQLSKVELHVTGTMSFNGNDRDVDRTMTTDFKDVGKTTVDAPAEAKAKLGT